MKTSQVEVQVNSTVYRTIEAKNRAEAIELVQQQLDDEGLYADAVSAGILASVPVAKKGVVG